MCQSALDLKYWIFGGFSRRIHLLAFVMREARMFNEKLKTESLAFNLSSQTTRHLITQSNSRQRNIIIVVVNT